MDNDKLRQEIASFRYGLISPIVSRQDLVLGETTALIREAASRHYVIPGSTRTRVGERTIERYLSMYREGGFDALMPMPRENSSRIPEELIDLAIALRRENPKRSIAAIIGMLEASGQVEPGYLKRSTLYDHFRRAGLTKPQMALKDTYRRYQAIHRNERWIGDTCHLTYLGELENPDKKHKVFLFAWMDDFSRKIVHAQLYNAERMPALEDSLKKAIITHGLPEQVYVDNGAIYSSLHFSKICARLGIHLSHSRPYRPQGRGKLERFFLTVQRGFLSELELLSRTSSIDIVKANDLFSSWLKIHYNDKPHSATKQAPSVRFDMDNHPIRQVDLTEIYEAFLVEETRKVDKTGIFSLQGQTYETSPELSGKTITVRFDPYDMRKIQVFSEGRSYGEAKPFDTPRHHVGKKPPSKEGVQEVPKPTNINPLTLTPREGLSYKDMLKG
ncbi:MAG: DDE-type integrase/transposase/recombinase [Firmicutes bacterium]|nr:DDE-type integrase/transposase/recombinase [Bacillota bacterium]